MVQCHLCQEWVHPECVDEDDKDIVSLWSCKSCRSLPALVTQLVTAMADMSDKMRSSEQARQDDRAAATAERAALHQQNELLRRDVATLNEQVKTLTWKTFRPTGQLSSLLIGSSLIKQVSRDNLKDTDVVCLPGGRIKDVRDHLEALPSGYESITLLVGGNDCDITPPPSAATIVATYGGLLGMAIIKARNVTVSSICPRMTTTETQKTIDAVNAGLLSMCDERAVKFVDNTPSFILSDGSVNDGYLQPDGVHITRKATDKIAKIRHEASAMGQIKRGRVS